MVEAPPTAAALEGDPPGSAPRVFISYASQDRPQALAVVRALAEKGIDAWVDVAGIPGGQSYGPEIVAAVQGCSALLLLCSAASLSSRNVRQELQLAWRFGRPVLPLRLEPVEFPNALAYWLEGAQWIDVLDHPPAVWLPAVERALARAGVSPDGTSASETDRPPRVTASNLPTPPTRLLGRERELAELRRRLAAGARLLTLTGPGGTGKTRLALELAHGLAGEFPDGAVFVNLAPVSDHRMVLPTIAETLGLREAGEQPLAERLRDFLTSRQMLLLLDNCEQVTAAAPDIAGLLAAAPELVILATSRAPLRILAEQEVAVEPLALPVSEDVASVAASPAVALFLERARAAGVELALTAANARTVMEIVRRLDGLPLAIELAAARIKIFPPEALLARLDRRLPLLTGGAPELPARQQTLRDTIAWSYDLLTPAEQTLFRRLAVFSGGCTFEAAEAVTNPEGRLDLYEGLAALVGQSLLRQARTTGEPRFTMLETLREYASEQLDASGEATEIRRRHAQFGLSLAEQAEPSSSGVPDTAWLDRLETEHDNLRTALAWLLSGQANDENAEVALRLAVALWPFWHMRGHIYEGHHWLEQAVGASSRVAPDKRAAAYLTLANLASNLGDLDQANRMYQGSRDLFQEVGDLRAAASAGVGLGLIATARGEYAQAQDVLIRSLTMQQGLEDDLESVPSLYALGSLAISMGQYTEAEAHLNEARQRCRKQGAESWLDYLSLEQIRLERYRGNASEAARLAEECLPRFREMGERRAEAETTMELGLLAHARGEAKQAIDKLRFAAFILSELHDDLKLVRCLEGLMGPALTSTRFELAGQLGGASEAWRTAKKIVRAVAEQATFELDLAAGRSALGSDAFSRAWQTGSVMTLDQALTATDELTNDEVVGDRYSRDLDHPLPEGRG